MEKTDRKEIFIEERWAVIGLPENAVRVNMNVEIYEDGQIEKIGKELGMEDIRQAFKRADEGYADEDYTWVLTEKGIEYLKSLEEDDE